MRHLKITLSLIATAAILVGCGGGSSSGGPQVNKVKYSSLVSFGDSLSDVGSYKVGTVAALGGGKFTINGVVDGTTFTNKLWIELMAAQLGLSICPAQTGLAGNAAQGLNVPVVNHPECTGYGQGGARVTDPNGIGHTSPLGTLTVPLVTQVQTHLARNGGAFKPDSIVFLLSGANDIFSQLGMLNTGATAAGQAEAARVGGQTFASKLIASLAAGATDPAAAATAIGIAFATENARPGHTDESVVGAAVGAAAIQPGNAAVASPAVFGPMVAAAQAAATTEGTKAGTAAGAAFFAANAPLAVAALGQAGAEVANLVKNQVVGKGANYVTVVNLPDLAGTPFGTAAGPQVAGLIGLMVDAYNTQLRTGLGTDPKILYFDAYTASVDQVRNPGQYGISVATAPACDISKNPLGTVLACTTAVLNPGTDLGHYLFSDNVHPTPYGHLLLARGVSKELIAKGWL